MSTDFSPYVSPTASGAGTPSNPSPSLHGTAPLDNNWEMLDEQAVLKNKRYESALQAIWKRAEQFQGDMRSTFPVNEEKGEGSSQFSFDPNLESLNRFFLVMEKQSKILAQAKPVSSEPQVRIIDRAALAAPQKAEQLEQGLSSLLVKCQALERRVGEQLK